MRFGSARHHGAARRDPAEPAIVADIAFAVFSSREPVSTSLEDALVLHRYPDFQAAIAGERIEILVVSLEVGRIGRFQSRSRQPVIPDRVDGPANGRDVVAVGEDRVSLFGDTNP